VSKSIVAIVTEALAAAGLHAFEAYPGEQAALTGVAAVAVRLDAVDVGENSVTVALDVLVPVSMGGAGCRNVAVRSLDVLKQLGAKGSLEDGGYRSDCDCLCTVVRGVFQGQESSDGFTAYTALRKLTFSVAVAGIDLPQPVSFSAWREVDEMVYKLMDAPWHFRLEELLPLDAEEETVPVEGFSMTVSRDGGVETYQGCTLTSQERTLSEKGLRRIRQGTATERTGA